MTTQKKQIQDAILQVSKEREDREKHISFILKGRELDREYQQRLWDKREGK